MKLLRVIKAFHSRCLAKRRGTPSLFLTLLAINPAAGLSAVKLEEPQKHSVPAATVDLRGLGFLPVSWFHGRRDLEEFDRSMRGGGPPEASTSVAFAGEDTLAVYKIQHGEHPCAFGGPCELDAWLITTSGSLIAHKSWPTNASHGNFAGNPLIFPIASGDILALTGDRIRLLSSRLEQRAEYVLEPSGEDDLWSAQMFDRGATLVLRHQVRGMPEVQYLWVETDTLKATAVRLFPLNIHVLNSVTVRYEAVGLPLAVARTLEGHLEFRDFSGQHPFECSMGACSRPDIAESTPWPDIVITGLSGIAMMQPDGAGFWSRQSGSQTRLDSCALKEERCLFALDATIESEFDGLRLPRLRTVVAVYDVRLHRRLRAMVMPKGNVGGPGAMSPSGRRFALVDGTRVLTYEVP